MLAANDHKKLCSFLREGGFLFKGGIPKLNTLCLARVAVLQYVYHNYIVRECVQITENTFFLGGGSFREISLSVKMFELYT